MIPTCPYHTFVLPEEPSVCADAQLMLSAAYNLREQMVQRVPHCKNLEEAISRLDKAVMVAMGAFHI